MGGAINQSINQISSQSNIRARSSRSQHCHRGQQTLGLTRFDRAQGGGVGRARICPVRGAINQSINQISSQSHRVNPKDSTEHGVGVLVERGFTLWGAQARVWPLHDFDITHISWCMAYRGGVGGGAYSAQRPCNSITIEWMLQVGGGQ